MVDASAECGYSKSYIKDCCKRGSAPSAVIKLLRHEYNIDPELYVCGSEGKPEEQKEHLNYRELYEIIYDAVFTAVTKALKDE